MGEIKSTLDLVMERTRHLSLSDEERVRQQEDVFEKRLQGLLQQYADGALAVAAFQGRMAALQAELKVNGRKRLVAGIVGRIDPDRDHRVWMELLSAMEPSVCAVLEPVVVDYRKRRNTLLQAGEDRLRECLARDDGISGSAVIPNALKDPACRRSQIDLKQQALVDMRKSTPKPFSSDQT